MHWQWPWYMKIVLMPFYAVEKVKGAFRSKKKKPSDPSDVQGSTPEDKPRDPTIDAGA